MVKDRMQEPRSPVKVIFGGLCLLVLGGLLVFGAHALIGWFPLCIGGGVAIGGVISLIAPRRQ